MKPVKIVLLICIQFLIIVSCQSEKEENKYNTLIGNKINYMDNAVKLYNTDLKSAKLPNKNSQYKILTYVNLYCEPCWNSIMEWKTHLDSFTQYSNVSFFCYVLANEEDFEQKNKEAKLDFPVFLDVHERFRIVNRLSNDPNRLTFLLNNKNEIILVGRPFTSDMKNEYVKIIEEAK